MKNTLHQLGFVAVALFVSSGIAFAQGSAHTGAEGGGSMRARSGMESGASIYTPGAQVRNSGRTQGALEWEDRGITHRGTMGHETSTSGSLDASSGANVGVSGGVNIR